MLNNKDAGGFFAALKESQATVFTVGFDGAAAEPAALAAVARAAGLLAALAGALAAAGFAALAATARWSSAFHRMMIQVASDMTSSTMATERVTQSPWVQTWAMPEVASCGSMIFLTPADGVYSKTKLIGTLNHMASGTPARLPGT